MNSRDFHYERLSFLNPLSDNPTKWSNTLKQFVGKFFMNGRDFHDEWSRFF